MFEREMGLGLVLECCRGILRIRNNKKNKKIKRNAEVCFGKGERPGVGAGVL